MLKTILVYLGLELGVMPENVTVRGGRALGDRKVNVHTSSQQWTSWVNGMRYWKPAML